MENFFENLEKDPYLYESERTRKNSLFSPSSTNNSLDQDFIESISDFPSNNNQIDHVLISMPE